MRSLSYPWSNCMSMFPIASQYFALSEQSTSTSIIFQVVRCLGFVEIGTTKDLMTNYLTHISGENLEGMQETIASPRIDLSPTSRSPYRALTSKVSPSPPIHLVILQNEPWQHEVFFHLVGCVGQHSAGVVEDILGHIWIGVCLVCRKVRLKAIFLLTNSDNIFDSASLQERWWVHGCDGHDTFGRYPRAQQVRAHSTLGELP